MDRKGFPGRRQMARKTLRLIVAVHLYLGLGLSLLFILWFSSGIVMMYSGYPGTTDGERLSRLPVLDCHDCTGLPAALHLDQQELGEVRLGMWLDRPVYRILDSAQAWVALDARTGSPVAPMSDAEATEVVRRAYRVGSPRLLKLHRTPDQWLLSRPVLAQLPLLEFAVGDSADTRVYVSPRSGESVLSSTASQRTWAWFGAVPHWLYFTALRQHPDLWTYVVIWLAALGTVSVMAGIVLGLVRFRYRTRALEARRADPVPRSPFTNRWMRWHHYVGLIFGTVTLTFMASGLLSMNPGHWSPGTSPTLAEREGWQGGPAESAEYLVSPSDALEETAQELPTRELRFVKVGGRAYYEAVAAEGSSRLVPAWVKGGAPVAELSSSVLTEAVRHVIPDGTVQSSDRLQTFDDYYYVQEHERPPLPAYRFVLADPEETRVYVDPAAGTLTRVVGRRARLERWIYNGLHSLDFPGFASWRPLWDIVMILVLVGGLLVSGTGTVLSWRWIRRWAGATP